MEYLVVGILIKMISDIDFRKVWPNILQIGMFIM